MAAAYAAVVTLMDTIKQIQLHPRPPISLDINQVRSLTEYLTFLQEFLENYSHGLNTYELADGLVSCIADAACAAEDTIELFVVDQIVSRSKIEGQNEFEKCLQKVLDIMDLIKRKVMEIKETTTPIQVPLHTRERSSSTGQNFMEGFDDALNEIMDKLTGQEKKRQIIPIEGMGGIGKTTLARNVYSKLSSSQYFDVCAWTTISQNYDVREFALKVLNQIYKEDKEKLCKMNDDELKVTLHQHLFGRRYLIIMDDIWSVEAWDEIKLSLPDCDNGSRVVATTRLSNFASQVNDDYSYCLKMKFLDDDQSWNLFCKIVFGEENCLHELEEIGKKIVKGCKGLPLSISVIGGLLAKSKYELEYWGYVAANLNSVVNLENNEECSKILDMSYSQLPIHLKPCFLHMGVFPEDEKIRVSTLIELWVVEGFLKPSCGKTMEVVAQEYFKELVDRNLVLVQELGPTGNMKYCSVHDLLRDFALREAQREGFYAAFMLEQHTHSVPQGTHRRVVIPQWRLEERNDQLALPSMQFARSLYNHSSFTPPFLNLKFLRVWKKRKRSVRISIRNMLHLFNLRYLDVAAAGDTGLGALIFRYSRNISMVNSFWNISTLLFNNFWNISTLIVEHDGFLLGAPPEIWKMLQLKHIRITSLHLPDPPYVNHVDGNGIILENLQTLSRIVNFKFSEEIIKRIPNLKKLKVYYSSMVPNWEASCDFVHNFEQLCKLQSFKVSFFPNERGVFQNLTFPNSLKKLTIEAFSAEQFLEKIGSLPHLVKLKLILGNFDKHEWATVEGQFRSLRFLLLEECYGLECWKTESSHFPRLQRLALDRLKNLNEIPSDIGDIPTLQSIHVKWCSDVVVSSARKIKEEQEENGNESFQLHVELEHPLFSIIV